MNIVKQNETYAISDSTESGWVMSGSASKDVNGSLNINFNVDKPGELSENVGDCTYSSGVDNDRVMVNYNVSEANRDAFVAYTDVVIDTVLDHFKQIP